MKDATGTRREFVFETYNPENARAQRNRSNSTTSNTSSPINGEENSKKKQGGDSKPIYACKMCRLHHKRCIGGRPCTRCMEKNYICENIVRTSKPKDSEEQNDEQIQQIEYSSQDAHVNNIDYEKEAHGERLPAHYIKMFEMLQENYSRITGYRTLIAPQNRGIQDDPSKEIWSRKLSITYLLN
ncbi:proline utilization trans-activator [Acrasis kona]|uniref:Proline utilization trans-activator n=1 Tax=Acrasis kona TaxID=1008807 RepID=A0AAW2ZM18_9EUKA